MIATADCGGTIIHTLDNGQHVVCMGTDCPYCALEIESETLHLYCFCYDRVAPKL